MIYPADHFPNTPPWAQAAVQSAIWKSGVATYKWTVPLEAIGRYESNWGNNANLCDVDLSLPICSFQLARGMFSSAKKQGFIDALRYADPEYGAIVAIKYINSELDGYGGYSGIGTPDGTSGLLARTDRGPGDVLRAWIADPKNFTVEGARSSYHGY